MRLGLVDPLRLVNVPGQGLAIPEYHATSSFSPDRKQLAIGVSAPGGGTRVGLQIVDLATRTAVRSYQTGTAAEAVAWVAPQRIVALTQAGAVLVVDAASGAIVGQRAFARPAGCGNPPIVQAGRRAVMLITAAGRPAELVVADDSGRVAGTPVAGVRVGSNATACTQTGLAVDPVGGHAYVVAPGAAIADVDLATLKVTTHPIAGVPGGRAVAAGSCRPAGTVCSSRREAVWLGGGRIAVSGIDLVSAGASTRARPAGVTVVDTRAWKARGLDGHASGARLSGGRLLTFGENDPRAAAAGVRAYSAATGRLFWSRDADPVRQVQFAAGHAYARTTHRMLVLDPASGRVLARPAIVGRRTIHLLG